MDCFVVSLLAMTKEGEWLFMDCFLLAMTNGGRVVVYGLLLFAMTVPTHRHCEGLKSPWQSQYGTLG